MLLKWLFTFLAILWLFQALRPYFGLSQGAKNNQQAAPPADKKGHFDNEGEYIDYEDVD